MVSLAVLEGFTAMTKVVFAAPIVVIPNGALCAATTLDIGAAYVPNVLPVQRTILNRSGVGEVDVHGAVLISPDFYSRLSEAGKVFAVAHELGHAALHFENLIREPDPAVYAENTARQEAEADRYAVDYMVSIGYPTKVICDAAKDTLSTALQFLFEQSGLRATMSEDAADNLKAAGWDQTMVPRLDAITTYLQ